MNSHSYYIIIPLIYYYPSTSIYPQMFLYINCLSEEILGSIFSYLITSLYPFFIMNLLFIMIIY